ncbi:MAG: hypothetical protein AAF363_14975 [Bacteroidota bacterium]
MSILLSFLSVFALYLMAMKTEFVPSRKTILRMTEVLCAHKIVTRVLSFTMLAISTFILAEGMGLASGIFCSIVLWTLLASTILIFAPFQRLKVSHTLIVFVLIIVIELS